MAPAHDAHKFAIEQLRGERLHHLLRKSRDGREPVEYFITRWGQTFVCATLAEAAAHLDKIEGHDTSALAPGWSRPDKAYETLRANAALELIALNRTDDDRGREHFVITKGHATRSASTLAEAEQIIGRMAGRLP